MKTFSATPADIDKKWILIDADLPAGPTTWATIEAVGDDEILVRTEVSSEPPEELFAFDIEGREPTEEELEALDLWYAENGNLSEIISIPVPEADTDG